MHSKGGMGGRNDGGGLALLLIVCGLDAIGRMPGGYLISGALGCLLFVGGVVYFVVWSAGHDFGSDVSPPPPPASPAGALEANGERHTPTDTSTETLWTNIIFIVIFVSLLATPVCWYIPQSWPASRGAVSPAVPVALAPTAPTATPAQKATADARPLLALRVEGEDV